MKTKKLLPIFLVLLSVLALSGCGSKTDDQNEYKLPLGDVSYMTEMDFYLSNSNILNKVVFEEGKEPVAYNYTKNNEEYTFALTVSLSNTDTYKEDTKSKATEKYISIEAGYYSDDLNKEFVSIGSKEIYKINKTASTYEYSFTSSDSLESVSGDVVIKLSLGSLVDKEADEAFYKENKKEIQRVSYRITEAKLTSASFGEKNLLIDKNSSGEDLLRVSNEMYLHYFNTSTILHEETDDTSTVLVLTLNSKTGVWQWIIEMLGIALAWLVSVLGGKYWVGVLIFTIAIRTLAWPIYAKTNSYSENMAKIQPEMQKIQAKYEGRTDQNSQMKQQMEMRELMKKNKVSVLGCLTPFLQMPIFIAVYQVFSRFPLTPLYSQSIDYSFGSTSFGMEYGVPSPSWILAIFVGVTMIGSQVLSMVMTKINQKKHENFYTKQQNNKQQNQSMILFMVVMTAMMVFFAFQNAGIAFYWVVGNLYQIGQTALSKYMSEKKDEKERLASGKVRGR